MKPWNSTCFRVVAGLFAMLCLAGLTLAGTLPGGGGDTDDPDNPPSGVPGQDPVADFHNTVFDGLDEFIDFDNEPELEQAFTDAGNLADTADQQAQSYEVGEGDALVSSLQSLLRSYQATEALIIEQIEDLDDRAAAVAEMQVFQQQIVATIQIIVQVDAVLDVTDNLVARTIVLYNLSLLSRRPGMAGNPTSLSTASRTAGELFSNLSLSVDYSYASFRDGNSGGSGHDKSADVFLTGVFMGKYQFGIGESSSVYDIGGPAALKRWSHGIDFYVHYLFSDALAGGIFVNYTEVDIDGDTIISPIGFTIDLADRFERWTAGVMLSYGMHFDNFDLGLTTALSSANKLSLYRVLDNEDTAWTVMADAQKSLTDNLSASSSMTFYTQLDNEDPTDGTLWIFDASTAYAIRDNIEVSLGYSKTLGYKHYSDNRFNASLIFYW